MMVQKTSCENDFAITYFINIVTDTVIHFNHCSMINPTDHYDKRKIATIFLVFHFHYVYNQETYLLKLRSKDLYVKVRVYFYQASSFMSISINIYLASTQFVFSVGIHGDNKEHRSRLHKAFPQVITQFSQLSSYYQ